MEDKKQPDKYTPEELSGCVGLKCIYKVYKNNAHWNYSGTISMVQMTKWGSITLFVRAHDGEADAILQSTDIVEIPVFDNCKGKPLFKLLQDEHGRVCG